jgi:hypothetical protein
MVYTTPKIMTTNSATANIQASGKPGMLTDNGAAFHSPNAAYEADE